MLLQLDCAHPPWSLSLLEEGLLGTIGPYRRRVPLLIPPDFLPSLVRCLIQCDRSSHSRFVISWYTDAKDVVVIATEPTKEPVRGSGLVRYLDPELKPAVETPVLFPFII